MQEQQMQQVQQMQQQNLQIPQQNQNQLPFNANEHYAGVHNAVGFGASSLSSTITSFDHGYGGNAAGRANSLQGGGNSIDDDIDDVDGDDDVGGIDVALSSVGINDEGDGTGAGAEERDGRAQENPDGRGRIWRLRRG